MGSVRGGPRLPNATAYYVAVAGILALVILLCCYFFYFCFKKVKELSGEDSPLNEPAASSTPSRTAYPVQQGVRDGATAMAKLCKQLPPTGKGGTIFPEASSPAATHTITGGEGGGDVTDPAPAPVNPIPEAAQIDLQDKMLAQPANTLTDTAAAS